MTLSITTIRINRTQHYDAQYCGTQDKCNSVLHNVAQHNGLVGDTQYEATQNNVILKVAVFL